jgi:hypothetical protein
MIHIYITDVAGKMARYAKGSSTANLTNVAHAASIQSSNLLENVNGKIYGSDKVSSNGSILSGSGLKYLFRYNLNTGRVDTNFDFNIGGVVNSIAVDGSTLIVGGVFTSINAIAQKYLAKIKLSDLTIDASFTPNLNSTVLKILLKNSELITSGNFTTVGGVAARKYLVSLDKTTGVHRSTIDTGLTSPSLSMVVHNNDLYFIAPGSTAVRKFSIANPLVEDMSFSIVGKNFNALTVGTSGVFVGSSSSGNAVEVSGVGTSKYVVKFNPSTGIRDALFLPVTTYLYGAMYLSNDESFLYTSISSSLIKLLSTTGVKQSAFIDPNVTSTGTAFVSNKIIEGSTYLIIGGNFNNNNPNYSVNLVMIPK